MYFINLIIKYGKRKLSWCRDCCNNLHNLYFMESPSTNLTKSIISDS